MSAQLPVVAASSTTFAQLQAGGLSGHLELLLAAQSARGNPSVAPTLAATGGGSTGGSLAAGTYYVKFTECDGFGETLPSPESTQMTVAAGNKPTVTFPALQSGNQSRNVYITAPGGAAGSESVLYATGVTGTLTMTAAAPTNSAAQGVALPTANTTGIQGYLLSLTRAPEVGNLQVLWLQTAEFIASFNRGQPLNYQQFAARLQHHAAVFAIYSTLLNEILALVDANKGTLGPQIDGGGRAVPVRTWP